MKTLLKPEGIALVPESEAEAASLALWKSEHDDFAFASAPNVGKGAMLSALGPRLEACHIPINVTSQSRDPNIRLIANFSSTPFDLDGVRYISGRVFGFRKLRGLELQDFLEKTLSGSRRHSRTAATCGTRMF